MRYTTLLGASFCGIAACVLRSPSSTPALFSAHYLPHRFCYLAEPGLIWTNVVADSLIGASYGILFACLFLIAYKLRRARPVHGYLWIFLSFGLFIATCGATHAMEVITVWWPVYRLSAAVKVLCTAISVPTAILFAVKTRSLTQQLPVVFDLLLKTEAERDQARTALGESERIRAELSRMDAELNAANDQMNHVLDSTSESVMKIGADWKIVYANRNLKELIPHLKVGDVFWDLFPPDVSPQAPVELRKTMDEGIKSCYETYYSPTDDWFRINVYPTHEGISLFASSITARKQTEQRLETERLQVLSQLNAVLDSTSDGVLNVGSDWELLYANRRADEVLPDLVIGENFWTCFPALLGTEAERCLRSSMSDRIESEYENYYESYAEWFRTHAYPTAAGLSIFFRVITEHKKLQQQLDEERTLREQRIVALSNMAGGLAHEISNPLAIIHGTASDLLSISITDPEAACVAMHHASKTILQTSDRAIRILRGLRGFAREAGNDPMEYASIYDIVDQAEQLQEPRCRRDDIDLQILLPAGLPAVLCRETQIGQILTNLLNNAADAIVALQSESSSSTQERWIVVEASCSEGSLRVDVTDSGHGIKEETRKRLMEPFFTTKSSGLGMGIGLSLSRAIATEHGGSLSLVDGTVNTCFRLVLPVSSPPEAQPDHILEVNGDAC